MEDAGDPVSSLPKDKLLFLNSYECGLPLPISVVCHDAAYSKSVMAAAELVLHWRLSWEAG